MRRYNNLLGILVVMSGVFTSCTEVVDESRAQRVEYQFEQECIIDNIEDLILEIEVVELESSKESLVSNMCDVALYGDDYILIDKANGKISRFDCDGNFITSIGGRGRAKSEFLTISGVEINNDIIDVYSNANRSIQSYRVDGEHIGTKEMGTQAQYYLKVNDGYYGYLGYNNGQMPYRLIKTSTEGVIEDKLLHSEVKIICFVEQVAPLSLFNDVVYVRETYSPKIRTINPNGEINVLYAFDFGRYNIPSECFTQTDPFEASMAMMNSDFATIGEFMTNGHINIVNVIYQMASENQKLYSVVGIERDGEWQWITSTEDGINSILFLSSRCLTAQNELIALVTLKQLSNFRSNYHTAIRGLENIDNNNDNPVILRIKLEPK